MSSVVIGTAGHIDHGKSALVEALTGTHPDRLKEEQARGITIDLGFAHATIDGQAVAFIDVPGHERFVRNMLAGAGGIDAVILVVAADESVMPQTREHFQVCRLLGIAQGVIAITKIDRVDEDTAELVALEVRELVAGSFLEAAPVVPVSVRSGAGLDAVRTAVAALAGSAPRQAREGVVRLPVDRVFSLKGFGTVVTGTLVSGRVDEGTELVALPAGRAARVRGVHVHGRSVSEAWAPARVALNLGAIEVSEISRGVTLATPGSLAVTRRLDVRLEALPGGRGLRHGARLQVHHGTSETTGRLVLSAIRSASEAPWRRLQPGEAGIEVRGGGEAYGRLRLERAVAVTRGDRLVLRSISPSSTIGGAVVLDPEPPTNALRRPSTFDRFQALDAPPPADAEAALRIWLVEAGARGMTPGDAVRRAGLGRVSSVASLEQLSASGDAIAAEGRYFHVTAARKLEAGIGATLARFHGDHPADAGMPREALRERVGAGDPGHLFEVVMGKLSAGRVIRGTERIALRSHAPELDEHEVRARQKIEELVRQAGLGPPDTDTVRQASGADPTAFERQVRELIRDQRLARVETLLFHADALAELKKDVQALKHAKPSGAETWLDVATFKARYGLSRKYAIPLLAWLDRERVTRRVGDRRLVL